MANYEVLEPGGHAALVDGLKDYADRTGGTDTEQLADGSVEMNKLGDDVLDELDSKAYADGYYAQMTVGSADNLTARGDAVEAEFLYRTSGGIADIESGNATIKSIKGNTVRWNQLCDREWTGSTKARVTTSDSDGTMTVTTNSATSLKFVDFVVTAGHTYLIKGDYTTSGEAVAYGTYDANNNYDKRVYLSGEVSTVQHVADLLTTTSTYNRVRVVNFGTTAASGASCTVKNLMLIDLTQLYGAGNEPTVAEFEAMYPLPYYAYDAGSLLPVTMTGIATDGFNQWDEEWDVGGINTTTGAYVTGERFRSKNLFPVFPNTEYNAQFNRVADDIRMYFYDADKNFISETGWKYKGVFTTPANAHYMAFLMAVNYGTTYKNDICINLSWSGRRNGEYEEYWKAERAIAASTYFPTGLKKAGAVYDELTGSEAITRVGSVDLGTLDWSVISSPSEHVFRVDARNVDNLMRYSGAIPANAEIIGYQVMDYNSISASDDKCFAISGPSAYRFTIVDHAYSDAAAFRTAMSGVYMFYELATPTTTPIDPPLNLTYKVDDWGTEKVMVPEGTVSAVPTFDIIYGMNAVDTIRRLPDLYAGKAETEAALDTKANIDGYYQQLTAGAADNLTGRGDATGGAYLFRTTAGTESVSDESVTTVKSIKGRTLRWNQRVVITDSSTEKWGCTITRNSTTNTITFVGTPTESGNCVASTVPNVKGHKYLIRGNSTDSSKVQFSSQSYGSDTTGKGTIIVNNSTNDSWYYTYVILSAAVGQEINVTFQPMVIDLTEMFGAGNEPSTVAEFNELYPLPYYPYDAGTMLPVNMTGIETKGFNQLPYITSGGSGYVFSPDDAARLVAGQQYEFTMAAVANSTWSIYFRLYELDGTQIKVPSVSSLMTIENPSRYNFYLNNSGSYAEGGAHTNKQVVFTPLKNMYIVFFLAYDVTDPCLHLVWSGYRNGEYEPYWSAQRLIDVGILRAAGTAYDEQTETERTIRIAEIDMGSLTWVASQAAENAFYANVKNVMDYKFASNVQAECVPYNFVGIVTGTSALASYDKAFALYHGPTTSTRELYVKDTAYSDADSFKAAMDGVILYYELAEPTVTTYDPPLNLDYRYADFGTERIMVPDGEMSAPPIIEAVYGINATDTIRNLPTDYISHASMSQFRLALMAHLGVFINETWDEVDNRYEYTITSE